MKTLEEIRKSVIKDYEVLEEDKVVKFLSKIEAIIQDEYMKAFKLDPETSINIELSKVIDIDVTQLFLEIKRGSNDSILSAVVQRIKAAGYNLLKTRVTEENVLLQHVTHDETKYILRVG